MVIEVYVKNNIYQHILVLKTNRKKRNYYKEFVVEGVRNINEAIRNGWNIKYFVFIEGKISDWAQDILHEVKTNINYRFSKELMKELSSKEDTSELMAVVEMRENVFEQIELSTNPFFVLFDRPSNKGNLGTLVRSCDALGVDLLIIIGHAVDIYDPDVIVSSMGSFFSLKIVRILDNNKLDEFICNVRKKYSDFKMIGSTAHVQKTICELDLTSPLMLMIGNETKGLSYHYKEKSNELCSIPMAEKAVASSFNVSCAASIMMYEVVRQRTKL
ncbi:TrmH family RNA methyltransferase [Anaerosporobacter sp.]|uniref:TrmH family RNA methyltransferase n=1 Tax=Anaerosporobacter sp. TaxID=1872529 RepID=UPI00286FA7BF|nr:TrmH family RNA methyltransferase [Anaerosporobacter sp.]